MTIEHENIMRRALESIAGRNCTIRINIEQAEELAKAALMACADTELAGLSVQPATITLTGNQLRAALDVINPDGPNDEGQCDDDLTFGIRTHSDDDGTVATGMCCWNDDTDGVIPLVDEWFAPEIAKKVNLPDGWKAVPDSANADEIVTRLYRRFKDWSKRGFGPDDVTWCEVRADILAMLAAAPLPPFDCFAAAEPEYGV